MCEVSLGKRFGSWSRRHSRASRGCRTSKSVVQCRPVRRSAPTAKSRWVAPPTGAADRIEVHRMRGCLLNGSNADAVDVFMNTVYT